MTVNRLSSGYEPDFDLDMEVGRQGEIFTRDIAKAVAEGRVEVKTDERCEQTGNVYIEFACKKRGQWYPSGITATKAEAWVFVLGRRSMLVAFPVWLLRRLYDRARANEFKTRCTRGSHPTQGVIIPLNLLLRWGLDEGKDAA